MSKWGREDASQFLDLGKWRGQVTRLYSGAWEWAVYNAKTGGGPDAGGTCRLRRQAVACAEAEVSDEA